MKTYLSASFIGLLLLFATGCQSGGGYGGDEAKTVAHLISMQTRSALEFKDQKSVEELLSSLDHSEYLNFGIALDVQKHVFASYFKPDAASQKDAVMAKALQSLPERNTEILTGSHRLALAVAPIVGGGTTTGYVIVGRVGL